RSPPSGSAWRGASSFLSILAISMTTKRRATRGVRLGLAVAAAAIGAAALWMVQVRGAAPESAGAPASHAVAAASAAAPAAIATVPGMPPVVDPRNLYSEVSAGKLGAAVANDLERIYVPNLRSNDVYVVD